MEEEGKWLSDSSEAAEMNESGEQVGNTTSRKSNVLAKATAKTNYAAEDEKALSEWELPDDSWPLTSRSNQAPTILNFDSPLKGDFTDFAAPVPLSTEHGLVTPAPTSLDSDVPSNVMTADRVEAIITKRAAKYDLGLTQQSRQILASGAADVQAEYMKAQSMMSEEDIAEEKLGTRPPLGTWEQSELAARRVFDILTMPIHGPSPFYKGRNPQLFTDDEAKYFDKYPRTTKNYNKFIWSLSKLGKYEKAKAALAAMKERGVARDVGIYTSLMLGCVETKDPREATRVFVEMRNDGISPDEWAFDTLMEVFIASGELDGAFALYDHLKPNGLKPSTVIFTTLVKGCLKDKDIDRAWKVFHHMRVWHCEPDEVMMSLMIYAAAQRSETEKAFQLYNDMKTMKLRPTHATFNTLLYACARRKDYYQNAFDLLKTMKVEGYIPDHRTLDMLLAVAAKGGDVATAELIFDETLALDNAPTREHPYAFMIEGYAMAHRVHAEQHNRKKYVDKAEQVFERMVAKGIRPTNLSLNLRLNLYTWNSMISKAVEWKKAMREVYKVNPDVYAYNSLIEMYGRMRQMDLALDQFNLMKAEGLVPNLTTYSVLLEGCSRNHLTTTGMKLLHEMKAKGIEIVPEMSFIINFRRQLVKTPDLIREIDQLTGKAYRFVMPYRRKGQFKKITYHRELTKEEAKRTSLYG